MPTEELPPTDALVPPAYPLFREVLFIGLALLVAPMAIAFCINMAFTLLMNQNSGSQGDMFGVLLPVVYLMAAMVTLVFGLPGFLILRWLGLVRWWSAAGYGFIGGALIFVMLGNGGLDAALKRPVALAVYSISGGVGGITFWWIWVRGSRSISAPTPPPFKDSADFE